MGEKFADIPCLKTEKYSDERVKNNAKNSESLKKDFSEKFFILEVGGVKEKVDPKGLSEDIDDKDGKCG